MAPGLKTYGRKNASINRSIDVFNALFAENLAKRKKNKITRKKPLEIKPLPPPTRNATIFDDSVPLIVNTDTTFDKLLKGGEQHNGKLEDTQDKPQNNSNEVSSYTSTQNSTNVNSSSKFEPSNISQNNANNESSFKCDDIKRQSSRRALFISSESEVSANSDANSESAVEDIDDEIDDLPFLGFDKNLKMPGVGITTSTPFKFKPRTRHGNDDFLEESMKQIEEWSFKLPNFESTRNVDWKLDASPKVVLERFDSAGQNKRSTRESDWKLKSSPKVLLKKFDCVERDNRKELVVNVKRMPEDVIRMFDPPKKELVVDLVRLPESVLKQEGKVWSECALNDKLRSISAELSTLVVPLDSSSHSDKFSNVSNESEKGISMYKCVTRRRGNVRLKSMPAYKEISTFIDSSSCIIVENCNSTSFNASNEAVSIHKSVKIGDNSRAKSMVQISTLLDNSSYMRGENSNSTNVSVKLSDETESFHRSVKMTASACCRKNNIKELLANNSNKNVNPRLTKKLKLRSSINQSISNVNNQSASDRESPDLFSGESSVQTNCTASVDDFESFMQSVYKSVEINESIDDEEHKISEPSPNINQHKGFVNTRRKPLKRQSVDDSIVIDEQNSKRLKTVNEKRGSGKNYAAATPVIKVTDDLGNDVEFSNVESEEAKSLDNIDSFLVPMKRKRYTLKPGKLWKRSLMALKMNSIVQNSQDSLNVDDNNGHSYTNWEPSDFAKLSVYRKSAIKIIPNDTTDGSSTQINPDKSTSYAPPYEPAEILQGTLAQYFDGLSVNSTTVEEDLSKKKSLLSIGDSVNETSLGIYVETAKEIVLRKCGQTKPLPFTECYPDDLLKNCHKIGEGVFGEVYLYRNRKGTTSVMKVIPIEGDLIVNGERQKKFEEILTEITIATELSNLRENKKNSTGSYNEVEAVHCVQGKYPARLLDLWDLYDEDRCSENDCPSVFDGDQLYIVLELANGGKDLESFVFNNSKQAYALFQQAACALAVAEAALQFEHRDLHWGNVLISPTDKNGYLTYNLHGRQIDVATHGVQISIIDFTLSRITADAICIYNDLGQDPDLFDAEGDYQFEIYRLMQKYNHNEWEHFEPYTNILWLHYMLDKMITAVRYKYAQSKCHTNYIFKLTQLKEAILEFKSAEEFVSQTFV